MGGEPGLDYRFGTGAQTHDVLTEVGEVVSQMGVPPSLADSVFGRWGSYLAEAVNAMQGAADEAWVQQSKALQGSAQAFAALEAAMVTADAQAAAALGALAASGPSA